MITPKITSKSLKQQPRRQLKSALALLSLAGLATGCTTALAQNNQNEAQTASGGAAAVLPTLIPTPTPLAPNPTVLPAPTPTPWPATTPWPTPTPWPAPAAWRPALPALPTLAPMPVAPAVSQMGDVPITYGPPDGVDVFGGTLLRWSYGGVLAPDEFFDIRIKPYGSNNSAFVEWTKTPEYQLNPWSGWQPGLYTWQIGIIKGTLEGETKHFIADTGRASQPFLIKWQAGGGGGGGSSSGAPGGGGGGGKSGGS